MKRRIILAILGVILCSNYSIAGVKEIVDDGKEIYIHTLKDHATEIIFPEAIKEIVRGFSGDTYVIQRKDTNTRILELMPTGDETAEITVTGVSNEEYSLRFLKSGEFYSKVTILPTTKIVDNTDILTEPLKAIDSNKDNALTIDNRKPVLPEQQSDTHNNLVSILPTPATQDPASIESDNNTVETSNETKLPAELNVKVTLKGNGLPLKVYLSTISQVTGYNVITTPDIDSQKTSINLENIEVWRALKSLLYKFGYGFKVSQDDLIITETETRIFNLTMPAVDQTFTDETSNASFANNTTTSSSSSSTTSQQNQQVDVGTKIYYENDSPKLSLWTDIESNVKSMITPQKGSYSINKVSGSIIVTDKPGVLDKIGDLVSTINESLSRQQSFEIQIIEVTLNNDNESGIDWNAIAKGVAGLNNISLNTNFTAQGFASGQLLSLSATGPNSTSGTSSSGVSLLVKALDSAGSVNVVSKPSITVSNMFPCIIQEVTSIPYISGTGSTIGNNVTQSNVTTSQVSSGLTMRLEAKINDDKTVLNISAAVNNLDSMTTVPVGNGLTIQEPQVSTKSITTNVSVEPGKTLILGGLISTTKTTSQQGIPYLDKIPFFGNAFNYKGKSGQKTELVIIITPKSVIRNL